MTRQELIDAALSRRVRPVIQPGGNGQIFSGGVWQGDARPMSTATRPAKTFVTPKFTVSAYFPPEAYANQPEVRSSRTPTFGNAAIGANFAPAYSTARSSDDLVRSAIEGRRASLAAERNQIISQLNSLPPGKGAAQRARVLQAQLSSIESQDRTAAHDERSHAFQLAHQATQDHKTERDIQSAQQHTALVQGLEQISQQHPIGTLGHAQAVLGLRSAIAEQYPLGKLPKEGIDLLKAHSSVHDDLATQKARAEAAGFDVTGFKTTKEGALDITTKRASDLAAKELKSATGLTPDQIQNPVSVRIGNISYDSAGKAQFAGASDGTIARIDTGTKRGVIDIPVDTYLKHGGKLSPQDTEAQMKAGRMQPTAPPPTATGSDSPQLVHYDFRTPTGAFGHDLPANLPADTVNAIASAYSTGDKETGTRLAQEAVQPPAQQPQIASAQLAAAAPQNNPLTAPMNPQERVKDALYDTPRGKLRWTGTGWIQP